MIAKKKTKKNRHSEENSRKSRFFVVGIGSSAGGIKALEELFDSLPSDTGMGFVVVQHLAREHESKLSDILSRHTEMTVQQVENNMKVEPNTVYVIPPGYDMALLRGHLQLLEITDSRGLARPFDFFFKSLAQDLGDKSICIILSGTGSDGSRGLLEIKDSGGVAIAQSPNSAEYGDMPQNAISTGYVDLILNIPEIGHKLTAISDDRYRIVEENSSGASSDIHGYLQKIFVLLRTQTGHDFSQYKEGTISRRVERRMLVHQIDRIVHYVRFLQQNSEEVEKLFKDLLVGVTSFFRDSESYSVLLDKAIMPLLSNRPLNNPLRIWVAGCATGEEAYSIAMLISEQMDKSDWQGKVQIFATDINREAVFFARRGLYSRDAVEGVGEDRLLHFFTQTGEGFRINKKLRDMVVFAEQNVIKDPPFSNLDLISCRNLLIYMGSELHKLLLPLFYHAMAPHGFLLLGNSENIGTFGDYFRTVHQKERLFQRQGNIARQLPIGLSNRMITRVNNATGFDEQRQLQKHIVDKQTYQLLIEKKLLTDYSPATVLINERRDLLYSHGPVGDFLRLPAGETPYNILSLVRQEVRLELGKAMNACFATHQPVQKNGLNCEIDGNPAIIDLHIDPVGDRQEDRMLLIVFKRIQCPEDILTAMMDSNDPETRGKTIQKLDQELKLTNDRIFSLMEEAAVADFESRSVQEELQSSNQELQSINEELETSREELQSTTEELVTVNQELELRVEELSKINNDMANLLAATEIGTIFLDTDLVIKRFTPAAARVINLIEGDVGRPLTDLNVELDYDSFVNDALSVLDTLKPLEKEVCTVHGNRWFLARLIPYRTTRGEVQGVVISFIDITRIRQAEAELRRSQSELEQIFNTATDGMRVVLLDRSVLRVNDTFVRLSGKSRDECLNKMCREVFSGPLCHTESCTLERILRGDQIINEEVVKILPDGGKMTFAVTAQPFVDDDGNIIGVIEDFRDISTIKETEEQFSTIFNNAADAIIWIDTATGKIIRSNKAAEKLLGWSQEELNTMHITRIHPPGDEKKYEKILNAHIKKGGAVKTEMDLFTSKGEIVPVEVSTSVNTVGKLQVKQSILRNLSNEKLLQKQLSWQKEMAARYLDITDSLILTINRDENVTQINRSACEIIGFSEAEIINCNWFDACIPETDRAKVRSVFRKLMRGEVEHVIRNKNPIQTAGGKEVMIDWYNNLLIDDDGKIVGILCAGNVI